MYQRICSSVLCTDICHIEEPFFTNLVHTAQLCWPWRKSSEPLKRVGYIRFTKSCPFTYVHQAKLIYSKLNCCKGEKKKNKTPSFLHIHQSTIDTVYRKIKMWECLGHFLITCHLNRCNHWRIPPQLLSLWQPCQISNHILHHRQWSPEQKEVWMPPTKNVGVTKERVPNF